MRDKFDYYEIKNAWHPTGEADDVLRRLYWNRFNGASTIEAAPIRAFTRRIVYRVDIFNL